MKPGREDLRLLLARLPSVYALQRQPRIRELHDRFEEGQIAAAIRSVLRDARERIRFRLQAEEAARTSGLAPQHLAEGVVALLKCDVRSGDQDPINGSGVLFHSKMRNRYAGSAVRRASRLALALPAHEADGRTSVMMRELTGAEDSLVARSVPAAFLLAVRALAEGREVVISRGQSGLIDAPYDGRPVSPLAICRLAGARVVETGATNKTRLSDYRSVVGERTALIVTARPSTYALRGFTEEAGQEEIVRAGKTSGVPVLHLAGDTTLRPIPFGTYPSVFSVSEAVRCGTPLIIAAGGGLVGGPACGLLIGDRAVIARIRRHSLWPAVQASGHVRAGFDARLAELADSPSDFASHPAAHMLAVSIGEIGCRARRLLDRLPEKCRHRAAFAIVEGSTHLTAYRLPGDLMPSFALSVRSEERRSEDLARNWLQGTPPLLVDCRGEEIRIDLRGVEKCRVPDVARILEADL